MEDDRLFARSLGARMLSGLANGYPVFQTAVEHCCLGKYFRDSIVIMNGWANRVSHPPELHGLQTASGHRHCGNICEMYFIRVRLFLDRLDNI